MRRRTRAVERFERLYEDLIGLERLEASLIRLLARKRVVRGIYLWGGVGRGKSFLMDSFYRCAAARAQAAHPFPPLHAGHPPRAARAEGQADPLAASRATSRRTTRLLCLDEFHITDITDAMMMKRLLESLFEQGVVIVTTSNFEPDALYLHGLQRNQFLPAIELIKQQPRRRATSTAGTDYRLRELEKAGVYHVEPDAERALERRFHAASRARVDEEADELEVEGRMIRVRAPRAAASRGSISRRSAADGPRGKADYIELAQALSHRARLGRAALRARATPTRCGASCWLVDEFYDRRVKLILSAAAPPEELLVRDRDAGDKFQAEGHERSLSSSARRAGSPRCRRATISSQPQA